MTKSTFAIILAAGLGSRLGEETQSKPKCLVEVAGIPILERCLTSLCNVGVTETTVVVGYRANDIAKFVDNWTLTNPMTVTLVNNPNYATTGTCQSLAIGLTSIGQYDGKVLIIEGDVVFDQSLLTSLQNGSGNKTLVAPYRDGLDGSFVILDESNVADWLHETHRKPDADITEMYKTINLHAFDNPVSRHVFAHELFQTQQDEGIYAPLEYAFRRFIKAGNNVQAIIVTKERWYEVDDMTDKAVAEDLFNTKSLAT